LSLGNIDVVECQPGDVIRIVGAGAGGYGDPYTRDPQLVVHDVMCGFLTPEHAEREYGVVIDGGRVDPVATALLRRNHVTQSDNALFDVGQQRSAFEVVWSLERYDLLTRFLASAPPLWRQFLKDQVFKAVEEGRHAQHGTSEQMRLLCEELTDRFAFLRAAA
jgi:N-methylhydantoinase B